MLKRMYKRQTLIFCLLNEYFKKFNSYKIGLSDKKVRLTHNYFLNYKILIFISLIGIIEFYKLFYFL